MLNVGSDNILNSFETTQTEGTFSCPACKRDLFEKILVNKYGEISLVTKTLEPMVYIRCLHCGWTTDLTKRREKY